jgi:hypothetical protein
VLLEELVSDGVRKRNYSRKRVAIQPFHAITQYAPPLPGLPWSSQVGIESVLSSKPKNEAKVNVSIRKCWLRMTMM